MNLQVVSEVLFALGLHAPRLPFAFLRALPLPLLHALRAPGLRETLRVATRASYYRDAFAVLLCGIAAELRAVKTVFLSLSDLSDIHTSKPSRP